MTTKLKQTGDLFILKITLDMDRLLVVDYLYKESSGTYSQKSGPNDYKDLDRSVVDALLTVMGNVADIAPTSDWGFRTLISTPDYLLFEYTDSVDPAITRTMKLGKESPPVGDIYSPYIGDEAHMARLDATHKILLAAVEPVIEAYLNIAAKTAK